MLTPFVQLRHIFKAYHSHSILADICLDVYAGQLVVLAGSSGVGKSTLLRILAGLEDYRGTISINGMPHHQFLQQRQLSMVFQDASLYPHLSVYENLAFPLRMRHWAASDISSAIHEISSLLKITSLLDHSISHLSGGQKQRVAIARALITRPLLCLMDEPLASLDADSRHQLGYAIQYIQQLYNITMIYVTHDRHEAMSLASHIAVMHHKTLTVPAIPADLYYHPPHMDIAQMLGSPSINLLPAYVDKNTHMAMPWCIPLPPDMICPPDIWLGIRPEHIMLSEIVCDNAHATGIITRIQFVGAYSIVYLTAQTSTIVVCPKNPINYSIGQTIWCIYDVDMCLFFDKTHGTNLINPS
jgi:ABC-type sugar transport system ATPase subunit